MARLPRYGESEATITLLKKKDNSLGNLKKKYASVQYFFFSPFPLHLSITASLLSGPSICSPLLTCPILNVQKLVQHGIMFFYPFFITTDSYNIYSHYQLPLDKVLSEVLGGEKDSYLEAVVELTLLLTPAGRKRTVSDADCFW